MLDSYGYIVTDPPTLSGKQSITDWRMSLKCSEGIVDLYRSFLRKRGVMLERPAFGSHISIIKSEKPNRNVEDWYGHDGLKFYFQYSSNVMTDGKTWWLSVVCKALTEIRQHYGLSDKPRSDFHISLGRNVMCPINIHYDAIITHIGPIKVYMDVTFNDESYNIYINRDIFDFVPAVGQKIVYTVGKTTKVEPL